MADPDAVIDLLVVGELCVDIIVGLDGDIRFGQHEQLVHSTTLTMGSSSAITACGAAALGARVELVAVRGDDDFGAYLERELAARAVGVANVRVSGDTPTGSSTHLTLPGGDRAILTAMGSIGQTAARDVGDDLLAAARHLHVGSYFLQEALWPDAAALFRRARAAGITTSLDGNFDPAESWDRSIREVLGETDVFFGNEEEIAAVAGVADVATAVEALLSGMPAGATVVCKLGGEGAVALTRVAGRVRAIRAGVPVDAPGTLVDTVGAGDTLAAGFLVGMLRDQGTAASLALGVAAGTASTRGEGGVAAQPDAERASALARSVPLSS